MLIFVRLAGVTTRNLRQIACKPASRCYPREDLEQSNSVTVEKQYFSQASVAKHKLDRMGRQITKAKRRLRIDKSVDFSDLVAAPNQNFLDRFYRQSAGSGVRVVWPVQLVELPTE